MKVYHLQINTCANVDSSHLITKQRINFLGENNFKNTINVLFVSLDDDLLEELLRKAEPEGYAEPEGQAEPKGFDEDQEEQGNVSHQH